MAKLERIFSAYDVRGVYGEEVDEDLAWKIGHASGAFLRSLMSGYERGQASSNRLVVGRDHRPHGEPLSRALIEGITSSGAGCIDVGVVDTPMVYFAINHLGTCGGIQVTASSLGMDHNGFKIAGAKARPVGQDTGLKEIKRLVAALRRMPPRASVGPSQSLDLWGEYRRHVLKFLKPQRKLKVVVDASGGMGGKMVPAVFDGAHLQIVPLNFEPAGPSARPPDPQVPSNLRPLQEAVVAQQGDLGVCLDGDADRGVFVDETGRAVRSDLLTALMARHFLKDNPAAVVVYDLRCSRVVAEEIRAAGGVPRRERAGRGFIRKTMGDNHAVFGGDLDGRLYFRDNFNCESGAVALATAVTVLSADDKPFSQLLAPLQRYAYSGPIHFEVDDKAGKMKEIEQAFPDAQMDHLDGLTCSGKDWWLNLRPVEGTARLQLVLEAPDERTLHENLTALEGILGQAIKS